MKHIYSLNEFLNESKNQINEFDERIITYIEKNSWLSYDGKEGNILLFSTREHGSVHDEEYSPIDYKEAKRISSELKDTTFGKDLKITIDTVDEWVSLHIEVPVEEKVEKTFSEQSNKDMDYLIYRSNTRKEYLEEVIEHYNMTDEHIHNLRLAHQYDYINSEDFNNVLNSIINDLTISVTSDSNFKKAFETNFKKRIKWNKKPYKVCYLTWNKWKFDKNTIDFHDMNEIIGEVDGKYVIGKGIFRGYSNDKLCLWEEYKGTKRESEFIKVIDPKNVHIIPEEEYKEIRNRIYNSYEYKKGRKRGEDVKTTKRVYPKHINYY